MIDAHDRTPERLTRVSDAFRANFEDGLELGAAFAVCFEGELVLDLRGGFADRERTKPFAADTLTPVFSTSKALAALMLARLVEQGRLDYETRVAALWPAFGAAGKAEVKVGELLSHQAGLPGFAEPIDPALWFDTPAVLARLGAIVPMWPLGSASGYHPVTFGFLAGELFRRVDGRSLGTALREDVAGPLGLDLWIGLPDAEFPRVAQLRKPAGLPDFGELNAATRAAFVVPWASPGGRSGDDWRRAELPGVNGHATAPALARAMAAFAGVGPLALSPATLEAATRERIAGRDLVLPSRMSWGAGLMRNAGSGLYGPGERTVGHSGWGGSCAFADPDRGLSAAYVMNRQSAALLGDPRPARLIEALYACL